MSFNCKCGCGLGIKNMDVMFLIKLEIAQRFAEMKFKYNSAIRCKRHNKAIGGSETSSHLKGFAVDIKVNNSRERFIILKSLIKAGFTRIGIYSNFIHVDYDQDKDQEVIWHRS